MIKDPGNAGTAGSRDDWPEPRLVEPEKPVRDDRGRRSLALLIAFATALVLLPAIVVVTLTGEWRWLAGGAGIWVALLLILSAITTYRFGPRP